ncbi:MAG: aspartyl protease family protein [Acidobacteriaceae bacterium]|nr:aspartyl protease family protein [Acidobacteriaceae bacterium]
MKQSPVSISALLFFAVACGFHSRAESTAAKQSVVEIPFELLDDSIAVEATVNGRGPFWMLLDTGADPSVVELETAKNVGLKLAATGQQGSGGGTGVNLAYETVLPVVQLGGLRAINVDAVGMDLSKIQLGIGAANRRRPRL